ncbi:hypothetical protein BOX15_Mlig001194g4 [Macrostomum lignano]|uniref:1-acyl-sn-glycerol-3-phosphate acyltransferase n=2 Tax=Macrostomum lignano TaxID=282301 RepID=A0A267DU07_9PLAT|nr:hypothetical protein BOX15_Mlig001194g4 [Macrostomum lignano]
MFEFLIYAFGITISGYLFYAIIFPRLPSVVRYRIKMAVYYLHLFTHGFLSTFPSLLKPKDPRNFRYPMVLMWFTTRLFGIRVQVLDKNRIRDLPGNFVVISNHQSSLDLIGISHVWPSPCILVAKKSLLFAGWFGLAGWLCGCVFVSRGRQSAIAEMRRLGDRLANASSRLRVWIFPEGTRQSGGEFGEFKKGAFHLAVQAQVPVVPVVFSSYSNFYSKRQRRFDSPGLVLARVLEPVTTQGLTESDVPALSERVRAVMSAEYGPLSEEAAKVASAAADNEIKAD